MIRPGRTEKDHSGALGSCSAQGVQKSPQHIRLPSTPIPPRASAASANTGSMRLRHPQAQRAILPESDISSFPTLPHPAMQQQKTSGPLLQHSAAFFPTSGVFPMSPSSPDIADLDTQESRVPLKRAMIDDAVADIDTMHNAPTVATISSGAQSSTRKRAWAPRSAGEIHAAYARPIAHRGEWDFSNQPFRLNPLDEIRWWLVRPGRIEFLLGLTGSLLLIGVTAMLTFSIAVNIASPTVKQAASLHVLPAGNAVSSTQCSPGGIGGSVACTPVIASSSSNLKVAMLDGERVKIGSTMHLQGQGFSPLGEVDLTHDAHLPCQPGSMLADAQGKFYVAIPLRNSLDWEPGSHQIMVVDVVSRHSIVLNVQLLPGTTNATITATPSPSPVTTSARDQPESGSGSGSADQASSAASPTPVSFRPVHVPTHTPVRPTPVPTVSTPTPMPTPTPDITPTPTPDITPTPTSQDVTPTASPDSSVTPTPQDALSGAQIPASLLILFNKILAQGADLRPLAECLLWVSYCLSMLLLGLVGLLHRRRGA
ncbi:MAG TPA: hypothetical protein VFB12_07185 [Ktedonobacteraceae bacterium]|nr:hypothetical protein [Ktedonobacteraceae bacterium]